MKKMTRYFIPFFLITILIEFLPAQATAYDSIEQAVGFYSKGSLINPSQLPNDGVGFLKLFQPRDRAYATQDLVTLIENAASAIALAFPGGERMQMGDFSQREGGQISGHASHQNGLDVDVKFFNHAHLEQDPMGTNGFDEIFVDEKNQVTPNYDFERNEALVKFVVDSGLVRRIFVDGNIKKAFCDRAKASGEYRDDLEWLRRLRPLEGHQDHFHIRIACPTSSPNCVAQEEPPLGTSCDTIFETQERSVGRSSEDDRE